jgi:hypothetical protein
MMSLKCQRLGYGHRVITVNILGRHWHIRASCGHPPLKDEIPAGTKKIERSPKIVGGAMEARMQ